MVTLSRMPTEKDILDAWGRGCGTVKESLDAIRKLLQSLVVEQKPMMTREDISDIVSRSIVDRGPELNLPDNIADAILSALVASGGSAND